MWAFPGAPRATRTGICFYCPLATNCCCHFLLYSTLAVSVGLRLQIQKLSASLVSAKNGKERVGMEGNTDPILHYEKDKSIQAEQDHSEDEGPQMFLAS